MRKQRELLEELRSFVEKALPTHMPRGGEADRQRLLRKIDDAVNDLVIDQ